MSQVEVDITCECEGGNNCSCEGECKKNSSFRDIYFGSPICKDCVKGIDLEVLETEEDYLKANALD